MRRVRVAASNTAGGSKLLTIPTTASNCRQRSGRAGRTASGVCLRLFSEDYYNRKMVEGGGGGNIFDSELMRSDLCSVVLTLQGLGVKDPRQFQWLSGNNDKQQKRLVAKFHAAFTTLFSLQALDDKMDLTSKGWDLLRVPLPVTVGCLLLEAIKLHQKNENDGSTAVTTTNVGVESGKLVLERMITSCSILGAEVDLFITPPQPSVMHGFVDVGMGGIGEVNKKQQKLRIAQQKSQQQKLQREFDRAKQAHSRFKSYESDLVTLVNAYNCWRRESFLSEGLGENKSKNKNKNKKFRKIGCHSPSLPNSTRTKVAATSHKVWCNLNYINNRSILTAAAVREQISRVVYTKRSEGGLGVELGGGEDEDEGNGSRENVESGSREKVSEGWDLEGFLSCVFSGVGGSSGGNIAVRNTDPTTSRGDRSNNYSNSGKYKLLSSQSTATAVKIHPSSSLFLRNPAPSAVAFLELVEVEGREGERGGVRGGRKLFMRCVNQIKKTWLTKSSSSGDKD